MIKEDVRMILNIGREGYDEYLESTDDWRLCKDDILGFTKRIGKRNFLDIFFKNYLPRIYRSVERLNVGYLSCEEVNMGGNDQESRVYKEGRVLKKIEEDSEKMRVKVKIIKSDRKKGKRAKMRRRREKKMKNEKDKKEKGRWVNGREKRRWREWLNGRVNIEEKKEE